VNVELFIDDPDKLEQWTGPTLVPGKVVIPLKHLNMPRGGQSSTTEETAMVARGDLNSTGYHPSRATVELHFPYKLGFAVTFYKVQGRTIQKLILSLCPRLLRDKTIMKYSGIFVGFSQVKMGDDIRILYKDGTYYTCLHYLTQLKPEEELSQFMAGFHGPGTKWNPELAFEKLSVINIDKILCQHQTV
jgi:hypothetical protein